MQLAIGIIFFSALFQKTGVSLTCHSCYSKVDWTQCDQQRQRVICAPWLNVCAKTHVLYESGGRQIDVYERGCFSDDFCTPKACNYISRGKTCSIQCCDLELCNGGTLSSDSNLLVGLSVAFIIIQYVLCR